MSNIATLSDHIDTLAKWVRVMSKEGVAWEEFILPMNDRQARRNLAAFLRAGCPKLKATVVAKAPPQPPVVSVSVPAHYSPVVEILGKDFISPEEVAAAWGFSYKEDQLAQFAATVPPENTLTWGREHGFMLVAGPPQPLSLLEIRDLNPKLFYTKTGGWYAESREKFAHGEKVTSDWLMLRKEPVPDSFFKTWERQQDLLAASKVEYIPTSAEVAWGVTTYKAVRSTYLLVNVYVRTSSVGSVGHRVPLGCFDAEGLSVYDWDGRCSEGLGLSSARKLDIAT